MAREPSLMIIAGEVSGDMHAARLVSAIRARHPEITFFGVGGDAMRAAGVDTVIDISAMAVVGISEVVRKYRHLRRVFYDMLALLRSRRPDAVILVDYPGFNLRFARRAHLMGFKTIYYICPQVWAWNQRRIPRMAATLDRLIAFFPFEPAYFKATGLQVDFVGNPLVDEVAETRTLSHPELPWQGTPRIALLPGSRDHEIERILPSMWAAAALIEARHPDASFLIPVHSATAAAQVESVVATQPTGPTRYTVVIGQTHAVLADARATLITSGTATLEASLLRCPMVITYRTTAITACLARLLIKLKHIGLVNIVAGKGVVPELLQRAATPRHLADALEPVISDDATHAATVQALDEVNRRLGAPGGALRAADVVLDAIGPISPKR
jgi:lipid-A-disaccharide synthase